nr:hypothetical protein [uncultured Emticicia sp.]
MRVNVFQYFIIGSVSLVLCGVFNAIVRFDVIVIVNPRNVIKRKPSLFNIRFKLRLT